MIKVCLDPGHGGGDSGALLGKRYEKDDVLRLALAIKPLLEAQGIGVVLTRTDDSNPPITERCKMANAAKCAYFLSLHRDGADATAYGISLWVHSRADAPTCAKAQYILDELLAVTPTMDRRVCKGTPQNYENFKVNVDTTMASALLELGYMTNAADNARFDEHFSAYTAAITKGICTLLGKTYNTPIDKPTVSLTVITGASIATAAQLRAYLTAKNPTAPDYADIYLAEGAAEGIRGDIAFAQSCIETDYWRFGGDVKPDQNNFAGIGATGNGEPGNCFASPQEGIRAQIQHLKAYANTVPLVGQCVDPRFKYVTRGSAPYVEWLGIPDNPNGTGWAGGKGYGAAILRVLAEIIATTPDAPQDKPTNDTVNISREDFDAVCASLQAAQCALDKYKGADA